MAEQENHPARLRRLAQAKAAHFAERDDLAAVAITGSVARGRLWAGSDVDLWAFSKSGEEAFHDGVEEGIYWEIDIAPLSSLEIPIGPETGLHPPRVTDQDEISMVEALAGCQIVKDETGALYRVQQAINARVGDWRWLRRRAGRYLSYGRGFVESLHYAPPLDAIVLAREAATRYGIAAYWMGAGALLTSAMRIPEQLAHAPEIHRLYREIFSLNGEEGWEQFLQAYRMLPITIQEATLADLQREALPTARRGYYDGALRYMRSVLGDRREAEPVQPLLVPGGNLEVRRRRVLRQVEALLELCEP
ncbi:MAG: nucleotidyltransferase domain-containing protein [Candidatus Promineifilaceae bacterium]|nr:nucleotidyltransferase domain-containing protein [Candidatus Promineifilaceae bacterium]